MKTFNEFCEQEKQRESDNVKSAVISTLFPELDEKEAEQSLNMRLSSFDSQKLRDLLENQEIIDRLAGRNAQDQIDREISVRAFIDWLSESNPMGLTGEEL